MAEASDAVIGLGGGTPTAPGVGESIEKHKESGAARVVYLRAEADTLVNRLGEQGLGENRPSLTGGDALEEMAEVFAARDPMYRRLADDIVDASRALEAVVGEVTRIIRG
jgi:shikimate kinase